MTIRKLPGSQIESNTITITQIQTTAVTTIVNQAGPRVTSLIYPGNDTAANTVGGQTVYINGSGFETNNAIYINGNAVPSKSFISASNLSFTTPALAAGIYPVYVINTDSGATAIFVPGYIASAEPTWVTGASLSEVAATDAWNISLSATGDGSITYALAGGSSLPSGISLAANGLISGTLTSPPESDTQYTFTVIATDAQNQDASRQFTITASVGEGLPFANNVLLIHANGTNNQNNQTFIDSSNNNYTITRYGNATQGSFSPFSQTGWSVYFENSVNAQSTSGKYLTVANTAAFNIGTGDFTLEGWIHPTQLPASDAWPTNWWEHSVLFGRGSPNQGDGYNLILGGTKLIFQNNDAQVTSGTHNITINKWYHVAACRSGGTLRLFVNGTQVASTSSAFTGGAGSNFYIGGETGQGAYFSGFMSNVRLVVGTALYTGAFTPNTTPLTAVSNTVLLSLQSNRYLDNSSNAYTVSPSNTPTIASFSPFAPTQVYAAANVGGSTYFDGTGDYLSATNSAGNFAANNFTLETWCWFNTNSVGYQAIMANAGSADSQGWIFGVETGNNIVFYPSNGSNWVNYILSNVIPTINCWTHLAVVRNGSALTLYVNGVNSGSNTISGSIHSPSNAYFVGYYPHFPGGARSFNGYFSGTRLINGTAVYTGNFTPPTAPPTNIANTSLLLNYTNAGIFDQTSKTVIETLGDAKVSTTQYKYGTGSMYFDGSGDYARVPYNSVMQLPGDFTVECWIYPISRVSLYPCIFNNYSTYTTNGGFGIFAGHNSQNTSRYQVSFNGSFPVIQSSSNIAYNSWTHIALVRSGSTLTLYINGVSEGTSTQTVAANGTQNYYWLGTAGDELANGYFNGYIDDFRVTRGSARYTTNFTPPTSALKDK